MIKEFYETTGDVSEAAAKHAMDVLQRSIDARGSATWVLAGGSSPMGAYKLIANQFADRLDWSKVNVLVGDERYVPLDHPDSNWGQISAALFHQSIDSVKKLTPAPMHGLDDMAADYVEQVAKLPRSAHGAPHFDLVWLGVGEDGHTLSLFPGRDIRSSAAEVIAIRDSPKPPPERITLSLQALAGAANVVVFATGAGKRNALAAAIRDGELPIAVVSSFASEHGAEVRWLFDASASEGMSR